MIFGKKGVIKMEWLIWLNDNLGGIAAIIGALYAVARMIVALTPTPKDNEKLEEVGIWLKSIGKIFGLDLTQGLSKDDK